MEVDVVGLCSEFPNDNAALHGGTIWVCRETTGRPEPEPRSAALVSVEPSFEDRREVDEPPATSRSLDLIELDLDGDDPSPFVVEELDPFESGVAIESVDDPTDPVPPTLMISEADVTALVEAAFVGEGPDVAPARHEHTTLDDVPAETVRADAGASPIESGEVAVVHGATARDEENAAPMDLTLDEAVRLTFEEGPETVSYDSSALPPAPDDPFTALVCMLADVAIHAGASNIAAILPGLLFDGRLAAREPEIVDALERAGLWDGSEVARSFVATTAAWRAILRGTSDDFDACGGAMLDEWASDLLAKLLSSPAKASTLRQELRSRGVAAFGLAA